MNRFALRALLRCASILLVTLGLTSGALAQDRPIRILVGFAPGGTADVVARMIADKLKDSLGQPVIVENRAGATGRIAAEGLKNSADASGFTAD
ncbi:MAG: tripartite tricarboxylate transporter substrate-binding protein [Betaproteobacteria bacterium]